jgi:hydroxymethylglutaryl-CoA reductase
MLFSNFFFFKRQKYTQKKENIFSFFIFEFLFKKRNKMKFIEGFSHFPKEEKISWLIKNFLNSSKEPLKILKSYWHANKSFEELHSNFCENTLSHFYLPFCLAPNFLINGKYYALPMVTEESSVVAAASKAAKFWAPKGGFSYIIKEMKKPGHVYFKINSSYEKLKIFFETTLKQKLFESSAFLTNKMTSRGGGLLQISLIKGHSPFYYKLEGVFDTCEAMGANFINSVLENFAITLENEILLNKNFSQEEKESFEIIMSILSNYTPDCKVLAKVECSINKLGTYGVLTPEKFASKFEQACLIANKDISRAVTHNKGILNGIDSLILATGNDFRAVEAACHAYASKDGLYKSLSKAEIKNNIFTFSLEIPLSLGTIGGMTSLHPLAKLSLEILQKPSVKELMGIVACLGLAQNFGAISSLITTGIQKGHMKMHLHNILTQLGALNEEKALLLEIFKNKAFSYNEVEKKLRKIRG